MDATPRPAGAAEGRLLQGELLEVARAVPPASVDLVYLDPPFATGRRQAGRDGLAFEDRFEGGLDGWLAWLAPRCEALRDTLRPTGSLYLHLDWRGVHHARVMLDDVFGREAFLNEVVWLYGLGGSSKRRWPRKHDNILWYAREPGRQWFEAARIPARSARMRGRLKKAPDWWDIPALNNMARERVGWPTQKPEALLERIVTSSCPPGGTVLDPCCGSGTTPAVAARTGRRWIAADLAPEAVALTRKRLRALGAPFHED